MVLGSLTREFAGGNQVRQLCDEVVASMERGRWLCWNRATDHHAAEPWSWADGSGTSLLIFVPTLRLHGVRAPVNGM